MKTVTLPIEEYESLVQDRNDKQRLMEELEADAEKRGFLVRYITQFWKRESFGITLDYSFVRERNTLEIVSNDKVLEDAKKEIERICELCVEQGREIWTLTDENEKLKGRGFLARLLNKEG